MNGKRAKKLRKYVVKHAGPGFSVPSAYRQLLRLWSELNAAGRTTLAAQMKLVRLEYLHVVVPNLGAPPPTRNNKHWRTKLYKAVCIENLPPEC